MQYSIGDRVRFMDFDGDGMVTAVLPHGLLEIEVEGMSMRVSAGEVVPVNARDGEDESLLYDGNTNLSRFKQCAVPAHRSVPTGKKSGRQSDTMEVDLHLDRIRQKYPASRNVPDEDALYVQLDVFEKSMSEAFRRGVRTVILIHGKGRGVLRSELLRRLREYPGVVVRDASALRYGSGALEVNISL